MTREYFVQQLQAAIDKSATQAPYFDGRLLDTIEQLKNIIAEFDETETEETE